MTPDGGTLATEDLSVSINLPADALTGTTTLAITDGGTDIQLTTELGAAEPAVNVTIGPDGTLFAVPVAISLHWADADSDGIVDGMGLNE